MTALFLPSFLLSFLPSFLPSFLSSFIPQFITSLDQRRLTGRRQFGGVDDLEMGTGGVGGGFSRRRFGSRGGADEADISG